MPTFRDPNNQVGSYKIIGVLGHGTFADVYLGKHVTLQREAAVKVLRASLRPFDPNVDTFPPNELGSSWVIDSEEKLRSEMKLIASFDHPNIIPLWEGGLTNRGEPYFVMPIIRETLAQRIGQRTLKDSTLPLEEILEYLFPIAFALDYIHQPSIKFVHGDIKPDNILRKEDGTILLADFGGALLSFSADTNLLKNLALGKDKSGNIHAALLYMAPERFPSEKDAEKGIDRTCSASDQYAVGVMAFQWITGHLPFTDRSTKNIVRKILTVKPPTLTGLGVHVDEEVEIVMQRVLAKNPEDRFPSVLAFVQALEAARMRRIRQAEEERRRAQKQREEQERREQERTIQTLSQQLEAANNRLIEIESQLEAEEDDREQPQQEAVIQDLQNQLTRANRINSEKQLQLQALQRELKAKIEQEGVIQQLTTELEAANTRLAEIDRQLQAQRRTDNAEKRRQEALIQQLTLELEKAKNKPIGNKPPSEPWRTTRPEQPLIQPRLPKLREERSNRQQKKQKSYKETRKENLVKKYFQDALEFQKLGFILAALDNYDKAIELEPNFPEAHANRGDVLYTLKRYQEALAAYEKALELDPNNHIAHEGKNKVLRQLGRGR